MAKSRQYIPALSYDWLTRFYDPITRTLMPGAKPKQRLLGQAGIENDQRVLDLGCGTGTLTIMVKQAHPGSEVVCLDADHKVLAIAHAKVETASANIMFDQGLASRLPYADESFDCVLSSLMFHHLSAEDKQRALQEVFRVPRPGGELHLADFGKPQNALAHLISLMMRLWEETADNIKGLLPGCFTKPGLWQWRRGRAILQCSARCVIQETQTRLTPEGVVAAMLQRHADARQRGRYTSPLLTQASRR